MSFQLIERQMAYDYATAIGTGDLVAPDTNGQIVRYAAGGTLSAGVFMGCKYLDPALGYTRFSPNWPTPSLPSTTVVKCYILNDPNILFELRVDGAAAAGQSAVNANIELVTTDTPNTLTGQSTERGSLASISNSTATLPLRIYDLFDAPGNDNTAANNIILVRFNTNQLQTATPI